VSNKEKAMTREELVDSIAEHIMFTTRGYKSKKDWPMEWDKHEENSQISMVIEDIEEVLIVLEDKFNYKFPKNNEEILISTATISLSTNENPSIKKLKNFIKRLEELKIEETTSIAGSLDIQLTFENFGAYVISCGECGEEDVLVEIHSCKKLNDN
jgi:hypothetical protein